MISGAVEWIRTTTVLLPPAPQAGASASSATTANRMLRGILTEAAISEEADSEPESAPALERGPDSAPGPGLETAPESSEPVAPGPFARAPNLSQDRQPLGRASPKA